MKILSGKVTENKLLGLIKDCTSFSVAVAWATKNKVFSAIQIYGTKLDQMIVGVDFYQTHPDVLNWMKVSKKKKMIIGKSKSGVFHPKIFLFEFDNRDCNTLVIGSANLTAAAFTRNEEACVCIEIQKDNLSAANLITSWVKNGIAIGSFDIPEYRKDYLVKGRSVRQVLTTRKHEEFRENPDLLILSFDEYYLLCKEDPYHYFSDRLALLDFCGKPNLTHDEFCCVAGVNPVNPISGIDYGLFGRMSADAAFRDTVQNKTHWLTLQKLYHGLPSGQITKVVAKKFIKNVEDHVNKCFGKSYKKLNHLSAGTRLLAMKRPDLFFCENGANSKRLADDLGITISGKNGIKTVDGYLDAAVRLQNSTWGSSSAPKKFIDKNMPQCWKGRVAMIDAIYYNPI